MAKANRSSEEKIRREEMKAKMAAAGYRSANESE